MARCGCSGQSCSCLITGGAGVTVQGTGTADNPYVLMSGVSYEYVEPADSYSLGVSSPLQVQSAASIDWQSMTGTTILPDGSGAAALPPLGSTLDVYVLFSDTASSIVWRGYRVG
jgi:hypothetical protein